MFGHRFFQHGTFSPQLGQIQGVLWSLLGGVAAAIFMLGGLSDHLDRHQDMRMHTSARQ